MGLFDGFKRQLRSVIEWKDPLADDLFWQWSGNGDEIKNASKLIVGPGQGCIFVYEGKVEAVLDRAGLVDLKTANVPFWTTISKFMQFFQSEHKVGLYYFRTTRILDQKWGTVSTVKYEDPKYKFPVGLRAFGNYSFRLNNPQNFFTTVIGQTSRYGIDDFRNVMNARISEPLTDYMAESQYTYTEIDSQREELSKGLFSKIIPVFGALGFEITDFRIEGTSFDEDTMRRINRIADMSAEAQAAQAAGIDFTKMQQLQALRDAASNQGGAAGAGVGIGAGISMGQMMAGMMTSPQQHASNGQGGQAASAVDPLERLTKLKQMLDAGLIEQSEFDAKKQEILGKI